MTILIPELADEDLTSEIQKISSHVTEATGAIKETLTDSPWGRRRLAYSVRHNGQDYRDGYYIVFHFDLEPSRMVEIERELKLDVNVMRYLLVHDDPKAGERNNGQQGDAEGTAPRSSPDDAAPASTPAPPVDEPAAAEAAPVADATAANVSAPPTEESVAEEADVTVTDAPAPDVEEPVVAEAAPEADATVTDAPAPAVEEPVAEAAEAEEPVVAEAPAPSGNEPAPDDDTDVDAKQEA